MFDRKLKTLLTSALLFTFIALPIWADTEWMPIEELYETMEDDLRASLEDPSVVEFLSDPKNARDLALPFKETGITTESTLTHEMKFLLAAQIGGQLESGFLMDAWNRADQDSMRDHEKAIQDMVLFFLSLPTEEEIGKDSELEMNEALEDLFLSPKFEASRGQAETLSRFIVIEEISLAFVKAACSEAMINESEAFWLVRFERVNKTIGKLHNELVKTFGEEKMRMPLAVKFPSLMVMVRPNLNRDMGFQINWLADKIVENAEKYPRMLRMADQLMVEASKMMEANAGRNSMLQTPSFLPFR